MADETCGCASSPDSARTATEPTATADPHWLDGTPVSEQPLPGEVQTAMAQLLGVASVDTLADFVTGLHRRLGGDSLDVSDLCHADGETPHWGTVEGAGDRHHFQCFYDALILAELVDSPVTIRTESPGGTVIEATVTDSGVSLTPADAVMSFGITSDPDPLPDERPHEAAYGAICPHVKAFPDRAAYEAWAANVDAVTIGTPLGDATGLAALIAGGSPADAPEPL